MHIYAYIPRAKSPEGDSSSDKPLAWCGELSGLRLEYIAHPEQVVVAYSPRPIGSYYGVLFLNGVSYSREKPELDRLLRERPALIAPAKREKAKRDAENNVSEPHF
ncbi:MAG: hypothetical protein H8F28_26150 [Fibrella sp.]|nr:hypothetical protein [Armatimonadota bacterium]